MIHWNYRSGKVMKAFHQSIQEGSTQIVNPPFIHDIELSMDGRYVATAVGNGSVSVYSLAEKVQVASLTEHSYSVSQV